MYDFVVIGVSAGGMEALSRIIPELPGDFPLPVSIVQHVKKGTDDFLANYLNSLSSLRVKEAAWREKIKPGTVYIAPAGYHLLIEKDRTFGLSVDPAVNFAIPSIDVLFETAAGVYGPKLVGVVLTGANRDGSNGLKKIKENGGMAIVQNPDDARNPEMPRSAIEAVKADRVVELCKISQILKEITKEQ